MQVRVLVAIRRHLMVPGKLGAVQQCPVQVTQATSTVSARVPFQSELLPDKGRERARLAVWVTHRENRAFAREAVNRAWAIMFGRPLVEPIYTERDAEHLRLHAHRLRGLVATFDHAAAMELAQQLERAALDEDYSDVEFSARQLKSHVQELAAAIRSQLSPR